MLPVQGADVGAENQRREAGQRPETDFELQSGHGGTEAVLQSRGERHVPVGGTVQPHRVWLGELGRVSIGCAEREHDDLEAWPLAQGDAEQLAAATRMALVDGLTAHVLGGYLPPTPPSLRASRPGRLTSL